MNGFSNNVSVIDTASNTVVGTPIPAQAPPPVALTPDGTHGFVVNEFSNNVSVIDTASNTVVGIPIPVGNFPIGVAITPNGTHGYFTNFDDNNVSVIDTATNKMVDTVAVGTFPFAVAVTPDGTHAYVANAGSNNVSVIESISASDFFADVIARIFLRRPAGGPTAACLVEWRKSLSSGAWGGGKRAEILPEASSSPELAVGAPSSTNRVSRLANFATGRSGSTYLMSGDQTSVPSRERPRHANRCQNEPRGTFGPMPGSVCMNNDPQPAAGVAGVCLTMKPVGKPDAGNPHVLV